MNPPAKPTSLHMIAVCGGLILLFVGTWFLVKKNSSISEKKTAPPPLVVTGGKPQKKAPADVEAAAPAPDAAAKLSMREPELADPLAPAVPVKPAESKPSPAPSEPTAPAMAEAPAIPEPPVPPAPVPLPEVPPAEAEPAPAEAVFGPFIVYGPPRPEAQPPALHYVMAVTTPAADEKMTAKTGDKKEPAMAAGKTAEKIKDVTSSIASTHDMEGEPEDGPVTPPPGSTPEKTTDIKPTTSNAMPGWELLHYQARDYVTANSIHHFYRFNNVSVEGKSVWFRSPVLIMKASLGSQELLINNIKFVMSYPVVMLNNQPCFSRLDLCKLIDPVLRPSYIGSTKPFDTVVIDPGHGGSDSGARGIYGYEKDFALKLGLSLKRILEQRGLKVIMTRSNDVFLSLGSRVAIANKTPNCIYISLHFNSGQSSATGIETFALSPQGSSSIYGARSVDYLAFQGNKLDSENIALATAVHAGVVHHFKLVDRGVKRARWQVLKGLTKPGILFEGGFVTNANDGRLIAADNFRQELASTIARSVINYRNALQPRSRSIAR